MQLILGDCAAACWRTAHQASGPNLRPKSRKLRASHNQNHSRCWWLETRQTSQWPSADSAYRENHSSPLHDRATSHLRAKDPALCHCPCCVAHNSRNLLLSSKADCLSHVVDWCPHGSHHVSSPPAMRQAHCLSPGRSAWCNHCPSQWFATLDWVSCVRGRRLWNSHPTSSRLRGRPEGCSILWTGRHKLWKVRRSCLRANTVRAKNNLIWGCDGWLQASGVQSTSLVLCCLCSLCLHMFQLYKSTQTIACPPTWPELLNLY